jgi:hypothetical protein
VFRGHIGTFIAWPDGLPRIYLLGTSVNKGKKFQSFGYRQQKCVVALGKEDVPAMEVISRWPR